MFISYFGKVLGLLIASGIIFAGFISAYIGINGVFNSDSVLSWLVSNLALSGGLTTTLIGGFGVTLVGPKLTDF